MFDTHPAFAVPRTVTTAPLAEAALRANAALDERAAETVRVFENRSRTQFDVHWRVRPDEVRRRLAMLLANTLLPVARTQGYARVTVRSFAIGTWRQA